MSTRITAAEQWPDGVIARYLTVGGATVDIKVNIYELEVDALSTCTGCGGWYRDLQTRSPLQDITEAHSRAEQHSRDWAQCHAEECRAMPRPAETT